MKLLTPKETAEYLKCEVSTLTKWRSEGKPPKHIKLNGSVRYDEWELDDWIDKQKKAQSNHPKKTK